MSAFTYAFYRFLHGRTKIAVSGLSERQSPPFSSAKCERLCRQRHPTDALALPELRSSILCLGGSHCIRPLRALRDVRQPGPPADFPRAWSGHVCLVVPPALHSRLSLRAMPEPFLFDPHLPAHRTHPARGGTKDGVASHPRLAIFPHGQIGFSA